MDLPGRQTLSSREPSGGCSPVQLPLTHCCLHGRESTAARGFCWLSSLMLALGFRLSASQRLQREAVNSSLGLFPPLCAPDEQCTEHFTCMVAEPMLVILRSASITIFALPLKTTKCEQLSPLFAVTYLQSGFVASFRLTVIFLVSFACFFWLGLPPASLSIQLTLP